MVESRDNGFQINFVYERFSYHSHHSGYDQIVRYLGQRMPVPSLERRFPRRIPYRWIARLIRNSGMEWYTPSSFYAEWHVALSMMTTSDQIYHFLYGENSYRYLGNLNGLRNNRILCTYHQPPLTFEGAVKYKAHLPKLSAIVVVASNQVDYFSSIVGKDRVFLVPHGIDTDFFRPPDGQALETHDTSLRGTNTTCIFVGHWLRDFELMRRAIELIQTRHDRVRFEIITREEFFEHFEGLTSIILRSGVSESELLRAYQRAYLLMLPLKDCTANNALLEGLSCGLPIVATDVGGIRDYVDESCGILVPPGDAEAMADAVLSLLGDATRREAMGRESRRRAELLNWPLVADQMRKVYEQIL